MSTLGQAKRFRQAHPISSHPAPAYNYGQPPTLTIGELLREQGRAKMVQCGCTGWVSGHPRATRGLSAVAPEGTRTYYKCLECGKVWHYRKNHRK